MLLGHGCESLKTDVQGVRVPLTSAVGLRSAGLPPGTHKDVSSGGSLDGQENSSFMAERGWSQITELFQDLHLDIGWRGYVYPLGGTDRHISQGIPGWSRLAS